MNRKLALFVVPLALLWLAACQPAPPGPIHVKADGSGDYTDLETALQHTPNGGTVLIGPGTFHLENPTTIYGSVHLLGAGAEQTVVVSAGADYVLFFNGDGPFDVQGITFRHEGNAPADVVVVNGGQMISFLDCGFTGAVSAENETRAGLRLQGTTTGTVRGCTATENDNTGIFVEDQAQPTLEQNTCRANSSVGISLIDDSTATVRQNVCQENDLGGILVAGQARPTLEGNICNGNGDTGIAYFGSTAGVARQNTCADNERHGIIVAENADPELIDNDCHGNGVLDVLDVRE